MGFKFIIFLNGNCFFLCDFVDFFFEFFFFDMFLLVEDFGVYKFYLGIYCGVVKKLLGEGSVDEIMGEVVMVVVYLSDLEVVRG